MTRLTSFPFTSHDDGYDAAGYPVYDRAVDSRVLRATFAKFFTNGVFPSPGTALQIGKADTGLAVTVQPGICIINGAMGGVEGDDPITLTLDTAAPQGNVCYAVMLRFDNTDSFADSRSILLNVVRGDAGENPTPPVPDTSTPEVRELRLGYVEVPSGATDLSAATVHNEKGLEVCPYAAPFEEIDMSGVTADAQASAQAALTALMQFIDTNKALVQSALDDTTAGNLQNQITALQEQLSNLDFSTMVDNVTIEYTQELGDPSKLLRVKNGGIGQEQIDTAYTQHVVSMATSPKPGKELEAYSWQELIEMANDPDIELSDLDYLIGQHRNISITGYGEFAFQLIGIGHDTLASGGTSKLLTFQSVDIVCNHDMNSSSTTSGGWASSAMRTFMNGDLLSKFPQYVQDVIVEVKKPYCATANGATQYSNDKLFIASEKEIFGTSSYGNDGTQYEYWSINNTNNARIKNLNGSAQYWWMRSVNDSTYFRFVYTDGSASYHYASYSYGCVPCFCIGQE